MPNPIDLSDISKELLEGQTTKKFRATVKHYATNLDGL
jgi:hypothetical protein